MLPEPRPHVPFVIQDRARRRRRAVGFVAFVRGGARSALAHAAVFSRMRPKHPRAPLSAERAGRTSDTRRNAAAYARHGTQMPL